MTKEEAQKIVDSDKGEDLTKEDRKHLVEWYMTKRKGWFPDTEELIDSIRELMSYLSKKNGKE